MPFNNDLPLQNNDILREIFGKTSSYHKDSLEKFQNEFIGNFEEDFKEQKQEIIVPLPQNIRSNEIFTTREIPIIGSLETQKVWMKGK